MPSERPSWPLLLPLALSAAVVTRVLLLWSARITHPFDLEWMEGGMLAHGWRLARDLPLYGEPGREFIPYIYPVGYSAMLAAAGALAGGVDYLPARMISILGVLAASAAAAWIVRRDGGGRVWSAVAGASFLGCYEYSGAFYDIARPDGLAIGLLAWAIAWGLDRRRGAVIAAALLLAAAFVVKQHSAVFGVPIALGLWRRDGWRQAARFAAWSALPALGVTAVVEAGSGGNYLTYLISVPASHGMVGERVFPGTARDIGRALPIGVLVASIFALVAVTPVGRRWWVRPAVVCAVIGVVGLATMDLPSPGTYTTLQRRAFTFAGAGALGLGLGAFAASLLVPAWRRALSWRALYGLGVASAAVVIVASMRGHVGGYINVVMPLHWVVAVGAALGLSRWDRTGNRLAVTVICAGLAAVQLGWHATDLWGLRGGTRAPDPAAEGWRRWVAADPLVPTAADRTAGESVVAALRGQPGPVWSPTAPWIAVQAGHAPGPHLIALWDIDKSSGPLLSGAKDVRAAVRERWWGTIVDGTRPLKYGVPDAYPRKTSLPIGREVFDPSTGYRNRPHILRHPAEPPP